MKRDTLDCKRHRSLAGALGGDRQQARSALRACCVQVMGAPIAGSDLRAQILTGGGLRLKNLRPRIRSRRLQMLFWATGTERRGLVSLEAKKQKVAASPLMRIPVQEPSALCKSPWSSPECPDCDGQFLMQCRLSVQRAIRWQAQESARVHILTVGCRSRCAGRCHEI